MKSGGPRAFTRNSLLLLAAMATLSPAAFPQNFEVASVRKHRGADVFRSGPLTISGPLVRLEGYTVFGLILDAYNVPASRIRVAPGAVGEPEDIFDTTYDVMARAPGDGRPAAGDVRAMLRNLLAGRFDLKTHIDSTERPVYSLVVDKSGPRLKPSSGAAPCDTRREPDSDGRNERETFLNCSMGSFADRLTEIIGDRQVVDATGLAGQYDFLLRSVPAWRARSGSDDADISPMDAVRNLGLKLTAGRARVDVVTVDHLGKLKENQ